MGPLAALNRAYEQRRAWTLALPHLGLPGCVQGTVDLTILPPAELAEPTPKSKDPRILGVQHQTAEGWALHLLKCPCSAPQGRIWTHRLVRRVGVHPLDIIVATWDYHGADWRTPNAAWRMSDDSVSVVQDGESFVVRTAVDYLWWTARDQAELEAELR